jgi:ATP-dependent Clp protease ATP-binding subunit ClpC
MGTDMAVLKSNYGSTRARKARLAVKMSGKVRVFLLLMAIKLFMSGIGLILLGMEAGWLVLGFAAIPLMPRYWWNKDLQRLKPVDNGTIDGLMAGNILGLLPKNPTPKDIAEAIGRVSSGRFLAMRFGLGHKFLPELVSVLDMSGEQLLQAAEIIRGERGSREISGGILALAIFRSCPNYEDLLARLQLNYEDIVNGVRWHDHIYKMVEQYRVPIKTGGVARDWSFGYTPILSRFGRNISEEISAMGGRLMSSDTTSNSEVVAQMIGIFSKNGRQNVALVGHGGVGKTSVVHTFAEKLLDASSGIPSTLKFRQVFMLDSAALISAAPRRGELEELMTLIMVEVYSAKNVILCLDNAHFFFEEGVGMVDLSNIILPAVEGGRLRMIFTIDEQSLLQISQRNPQLVNSLNRINLTPANYQDTLTAMEDQVLSLEHQYGVTYMYQALKKAYELSERYVYDLVQPGRAIKLLESAANYAEDDRFVTAQSVEMAIERTSGVKVGVASGGDEKEKLLNLEELIHKRMVNQVKAVQVVSDALRRARTGVKNENRPIGTFLFLGPTGVGKTELAKALSDVYFDGEGNMVRVDLNQYVTINDVEKLIADGADNPNSLTAQVMKRPFSVVLLDEIEKAHPNVLTALLQVLDEGVMRDSQNREVNFRDTIVVATSNAGADKIREYIDAGKDISEFEDELTDELISSGQFKPEFLNRFDDIVIFKPLGKEELIQVVDLIIAGVNRTLAPQKVEVSVDNEGKELLVEAGYDPRLGARPMRRVVQRVVENLVAKEILKGEVRSGSKVIITADDVRAGLAAK